MHATKNIYFRILHLNIKKKFYIVTTQSIQEE